MKLTAVPGVRVLRTYERAWLPKDVVAGLVLTALLVPQGMAYAELAGLPPITGLYTSILCLTAYALVGPSKILVLGPDSSLGPMIAATILPLVGAGGDPAKAVALASMLALLVGAIMLLAGVAKLGFIADLLSKPTQIGYMNGLALTILVGQLPKLFGFSVDADGFIPELKGFVHGLAGGETVAAALAVGVGRTRPDPRPAERDAEGPGGPRRRRAVDPRGERVRPHGVGRVRGRTAAERIPSVHDPRRLVLGPIPPARRRVRHRVRRARRHDLHGILVRGPRGRPVHGNQEMIGIGAANVAAGLFQGFPVARADPGPPWPSRRGPRPRSRAWSERARSC